MFKECFSDCVIYGISFFEWSKKILLKANVFLFLFRIFGEIKVFGALLNQRYLIIFNHKKSKHKYVHFLGVSLFYSRNSIKKIKSQIVVRDSGIGVKLLSSDFASTPFQLVFTKHFLPGLAYFSFTSFQKNMAPPFDSAEKQSSLLFLSRT